MSGILGVASAYRRKRKCVVNFEILFNCVWKSFFFFFFFFLFLCASSAFLNLFFFSLPFLWWGREREREKREMHHAHNWTNCYTFIVPEFERDPLSNSKLYFFFFCFRERLSLSLTQPTMSWVALFVTLSIFTFVSFPISPRALF